MAKSAQDAPLEWRSVSPLDVVRGDAWRSALFCTFSLSLGFFEGVLLPHFRRSGARELDIVADLTGVRDALGESGAREVGRAYTVNPCWILNGVFHPKLTALEGDATHLLIGSGNLTFRGWGGNTELVEHLVASAHPAAFADVAAFLDDLAKTPRAQCGDGEPISRWSQLLRRQSRGASEGAVRVIHNVGRPIAEQLAAYAEELGGATRVLVASPYFGGVRAVTTLAETLGVGSIEVHVPQALAYHGEIFAFAKAKIARPVALCLISDDDSRSARPLHAKLIEIICNRGRMLLTGSVNASMPALAEARNIELGVLRIERTSTAGLARRAVATPAPLALLDEGSDSPDERLVLYARADGDHIAGQLMGHRVDGDWSAALSWAGSRAHCGDISVDAEGKFSFKGPPLTAMAYGAGRATLQLRRDGVLGEGFLALSDNLELGRHIGAAAGPLMRTASGTGDDEDLAAVLEWVARFPETSLGPWQSKAAETPAESVEVSRFVALKNGAILTDEELDLVHVATPTTGRLALDRLLDRLRLQLRTPRSGPALTARSDHVEAEDQIQDGDYEVFDEAFAEDLVLNAFDLLWARFKSDVAADPSATLTCMADFAKFVLVRRGASVERIQKVVNAWSVLAVQYLTPSAGDEVLNLARTFIILAAALDGGVMRARRRLLHLSPGAGCDPFEVNTANISMIDRLIEASAGASAFEDTRQAVRTVRTAFDEFIVLRDSITSGQPVPALGAVEKEPEVIAIRSFLSRGRPEMIRFITNGAEHCPQHSRKLPSAQAYRLRTLGLAKADCCDRILVNIRP